MKKTLMILLVLVVAAAAYAVMRPGIEREEPTDALVELSTVLHKLDTVTTVTIEGTFTARDLADSTRNMETTFCYSRDGDQAYYRVGQQEMISLTDAYIVVAHDVHKVFISSPREIVSPVQLAPGKEASLLAEEGYAVTRRVDEQGVHIALRNSIHPTCRAYDITYDSTGWIKRTFMRVADEADPVDTTRDKFIGVSIRRCEPGVMRKVLLDKERYSSLDASGYEIIKDR